MAKHKQVYQNELIPRTQFWANCCAVGCRRGYTARDRATAGHHCICGAVITWNDGNSKDRPTFMSYKNENLRFVGCGGGNL